jgi:hypothetical protein
MEDMKMSTSKTDICNLALSRFGGGKINSLDDGTETARLLDLNYNNCLESALRDFPWNFARNIRVLALTDDTAVGYDYVYQYPANCVNVLRVYAENNSRKKEKDEFKIFTNGNEKFIATDVENAYVEFTYKVIVPDIYDALFIKAFSYQLAAEIVNAKNGNSQKAQEMAQKYQIAIAEAQHMGAVETSIPFELPTSYLKGRS